MRLLHGSNVEIVQPNLAMCQSMNDYGRGFYLTPQWQRAYLMAKRRAGRDGGEPVVTPFLYYPSKAEEHGLKVKEFKGFSADPFYRPSIGLLGLGDYIDEVAVVIIL